MNREKWLQHEIDVWRRMELINENTAAILANRYTPKKSANILMALFSVIGSALIGAGIIMLFAWNWHFIPVYIKVFLAFLPITLSQGLAVYVVMKKMGSTAWREGAAILTTASVFTVVAMVGQVFHLTGDFGTYVLTCGLMSLPMVYILNTASPLLVYYWTIVHWTVLDLTLSNSLILLGLFVLGALFVYVCRRQTGPRLVYMVWITIAAGFFVIVTFGIALDASLLLLSLGYFIALVSIQNRHEPIRRPCTIIGTAGAIATMAMLTYKSNWNYWYYYISPGETILVGCMLIVAVYYIVKAYRTDKTKFAYLTVLVSLCIIRYIWAAFNLDEWPYDFLFATISNIVFFAYGVGFIVRGAKSYRLFTVNFGMAMVCALIVMRFLDSEMSLSIKGIVFVLLGGAFLLANLKIVKMKERSEKEAAA